MHVTCIMPSHTLRQPHHALKSMTTHSRGLARVACFVHPQAINMSPSIHSPTIAPVSNIDSDRNVQQAGRSVSQMSGPSEAVHGSVWYATHRT